MPCENQGILKFTGGFPLQPKGSKAKGTRHGGTLHLKPLFFFLLVYFFALSPTAHAMSDAQEIRIGRQAADEVERRYGICHDPVWEAKLQQMAQLLIPHLTRNLPWTFKLINMKEANAFALPGGFVFVSKGILPYFTDDNELAAVLAHEVSHVELKHFQKMYARETAMNMGALAAMILTQGAARPFLNVASVLDNIVLEPKYSRAQETQADLNGMKILVECGIDPHAMIDLFQEFQKREGDSGSYLLWINVADHPKFSERIHAIDLEMVKYPSVPALSGSGPVLRGEVLPDTVSGDKNNLLVVQTASGQYQFQWEGDTTGIDQIAFQALGANQQPFGKAVATHTPFEAQLKTSQPATAYQVTLSYVDGTQAILTYPAR